MDKRGRYIVIEGGDGAGKDTHLAFLQKEFPDFIYTREPGGTRLGKELRQMLLHGSHGEIALGAELFLFLADRAQHAQEVIVPALKAGKVVVSNRSWISFLAYQVHGREQYDWKPLVDLSVQKIFQDIPLHLAIILDVPSTIGKERQRKMGKALDTMESMELQTHERIRQAYRTIAQGLPQARVIDASRELPLVWSDVHGAVKSIL